MIKKEDIKKIKNFYLEKDLDIIPFIIIKTRHFGHTTFSNFVHYYLLRGIVDVSFKIQEFELVDMDVKYNDGYYSAKNIDELFNILENNYSYYEIIFIDNINDYLDFFKKNILDYYSFCKRIK